MSIAPKSLPPGVYVFEDEPAGTVEIGRGMFGVCFLAKLGPLKCCKKVHSSEPKFLGFFYNELLMLKELCHENLPYLFGAYIRDDGQKSILMSLHLFTESGESMNIDGALSKDVEQPLSLDWLCILHVCGSLSAIEYIHSKQILHNDIKGNNVVIESLAHGLQPVLINFGKACYLKDGRKYNLSTEQRKRYAKQYPQVAPEIHDGIAFQSCESDVYSFGQILLHVNNEKLKIPVLNRMANECLSSNYKMCPNIKDLRTFVSNLSSCNN